MKVTIPVKKTVTETVELPQLPYFSNRYGSLYYMITEDQQVVLVANRKITYWSPNDIFYSDNLVEAYQAEECTREEFDNAVAETMKRINAVLNPAQGAVIHTMNNFDPNSKQAEATEQATEVAEQNAVESAAQDQAVEVDSEEGTTEG